MYGVGALPIAKSEIIRVPVEGGGRVLRCGKEIDEKELQFHWEWIRDEARATKIPEDVITRTMAVLDEEHRKEGRPVASREDQRR